MNAYTNLSVQSPIYASQTTLQQLLSSPAYQNQIASAFVSTYSDWKLESDKARGDLANIIADSIGRGINPRETASIVSKRLDVSMSRAKNIAQTEQVGALRKAQRLETEWSRDRLGLNTAMLHLSALKPTSRSWHVARHGKHTRRKKLTGGIRKDPTGSTVTAPRYQFYLTTMAAFTTKVWPRNWTMNVRNGSRQKKPRVANSGFLLPEIY